MEWYLVVWKVYQMVDKKADSWELLLVVKLVEKMGMKRVEMLGAMKVVLMGIQKVEMMAVLKAR